MIADRYTLQAGLTKCEAALMLEYTKETVDDWRLIIKKAKENLENRLQCKLTEPLYTIQAKNALVSQSIDVALNGMAAGIELLSALYVMSIYLKSAKDFDLADVNYLGNDRGRLATGFKMLADRVFYPQAHDEMMAAIKANLNNVTMTQLKRLLLVMIMFDELGITEGVAACANLLYLGVIQL